MKINENDFTFTAWVFLAPVYVRDKMAHVPLVVPRGVPDWWLSINKWVAAIFSSKTRYNGRFLEGIPVWRVRRLPGTTPVVAGDTFDWKEGM